MNSKISKTPREVVQELDQFIVGQASAKRALAVALRNRYRRLLLNEEMQKEVTPKNLLMIGPTGVGKTELARRLAKLVDAPFVKVEATKFTEVGYVGRDVESMVRDLVENAISIVQKQKQEDVRPQAYDKAVRKLAKILKPGIMKKVANPQQDSLMNLFQSMGLPKTDLPQEEKEEVTEEIAASRREIEQQLRNGLLKNQEVTIEVEEKPLRMAGNSNGMEQMIQIQSMLDQMTPKKRSKRTVSVEEALDILTEQEADQLVNKDDVHAEALKLAETSGIIFIDEIDKIAAKGHNGGEVSREGVQRDILPIVEGSQVQTKYGTIQTDHILFIASGAFHVAKPSDLMPELQGRFPIRVELQDLSKDDFERILTEPKNALLKQYKALLATENVEVIFTKEAVSALVNTLSGVLGTLLKVDLFIASPEGRILGVHDHFKLNNARMHEYVSTRQFPDFYMNALNSIETNLENISVDAELTIFPVELKQEYLEAKTTIIPIYASGNRLGFVVMGKAKESFSAGDLILAEHAATVIGTELLHWQTKRIEQENREKQNVHLALKSLSYSEIEAIKIILSLFDGIELRFTALKIAKEFDITRTVIVNAIRKLESAGVLESRSLGTKGTFLRIKNQHIHQALNDELKNL